jgi:hypothetical protein
MSPWHRGSHEADATTDRDARGAGVAIAITLAFAALRGEWRWYDVIGTAAAFYGFRWFFLNGGISPGYSDPAIEQSRTRRAEKRQARREREH